MAKRRRPARSTIAFRWILVASAALIAFFYYRPIRSYLETRDALAGRAAEVQRLRAQNQLLRRQLTTSATTAALEREARRLGLVKPGERLFIVKGIPQWQRAQHSSQGK